jgi:predicted AlkP superfamily pyrophosphatase or phosphodiesterase
MSTRASAHRIALLAFLLLPAAAPRMAAPAAGAPGISRALIVSIDGLRPDLLLRANTPVIRRLMEQGSFTMWARTTAAAVTLPSHASMLTGVAPGKHGIDWNSNLPLRNPIYPAWPTLFEVARERGYTTAMVAGKSKFSALARPGSLDWSYVPTEAVISDKAVADTASLWIRRYAPRVLFVHLPEVDTVGHAKGWGSPAQLEAIAAADRCVGQILASLRNRGALDSTVVLITSDHGGAGRSHGPDDVRSREIPWIISGPGICRNLDLTMHQDLEIRTEDTFATICYLLGITLSKPVDGRAVTEILCPRAR